VLNELEISHRSIILLVFLLAAATAGLAGKEIEFLGILLLALVLMPTTD